MPTRIDPPSAAVIAAHRFGLGEASLATVGHDATGWLLDQIGPAEPQRGDGLPSGVEGLRRYANFIRQQRQAAGAASAAAETAATPLRQTVLGDVRARLLTASQSPRPFNERLALFWANHFTVSIAKGSVRGIAGAFEREAIRPHIAGNFATLLRAAVLHAGMLRYLDNDNSAGPDSPLVRRLARRPRAEGEPGPRITGLNENLAREVLELHTLGVAGGYSQADVTALAQVLTGWRLPLREWAESAPSSHLRGCEWQTKAQAHACDWAEAGGGIAQGRFDAAWHQPGHKTVLGKSYAAGPDALEQVLQDLAHHRATARFISSKLARHFVADDPPPALVARLAADFEHTGGDLPSLYRTLVQSPEAWAPQPAKLKSPEEFAISTARLLKVGDTAFARLPDLAIGQMGQRVQAAPSPAGWPDRAEEWLGPDALWKRVEWATRVAALWGRQVDARALAAASLGPRLQADTLQHIERAADGPQALALLLLAPEFQRR